MLPTLMAIGIGTLTVVAICLVVYWVRESRKRSQLRIVLQSVCPQRISQPQPEEPLSQRPSQVKEAQAVVSRQPSYNYYDSYANHVPQVLNEAGNLVPRDASYRMTAKREAEAAASKHGGVKPSRRPEPEKRRDEDELPTFSSWALRDDSPPSDNRPTHESPPPSDKPTSDGGGHFGGAGASGNWTDDSPSDTSSSNDSYTSPSSD
jgi:hypothetical protein